MKNINKVLATVIAMLVIILVAIGADKGLQYYEEIEYEQLCQEMYAENYAKAENLRTQIEQISQDEEGLQTFISDYGLIEDEDEDVLSAFETSASQAAAVSETLVSEDTVSVSNFGDGAVSGNLLSDEGTWEGAGFGSEDAGASASGQGVSENAILGNGISANDVSGNGLDDHTVSEDAVSDNTVSGNMISGNDVSGNTVSGNPVSAGSNRLVQTTLKERRIQSSSYAWTVEAAKADRELLESCMIDFSDKKIACLGDSITEAANLSNMENYQQYSYPTYLAEILGAKEVVNLGIGGSSLGRYWQDAFVERYREIPEDTDIIFVMGGTNDGFCLHTENVGNFEERLPRTLIGDLDELMRGLKADYPDAEVVFVTPLPNVLHDMLRSERPQLLSQRVVVDTMIRLAHEYGFDVIDLYDSNFLDSHDAAVISNYVPDGVHCNPEGYRLLAQHLAADFVRLREQKETGCLKVTEDLVPAEEVLWIEDKETAEPEGTEEGGDGDSELPLDENYEPEESVDESDGDSELPLDENYEPDEAEESEDESNDDSELSLDENYEPDEAEESE